MMHLQTDSDSDPLPKPRVAVIILNWNGWIDTLQCISSVLQSNYPNYRVIICDNHSCDDSMVELESFFVQRLYLNELKAPSTVIPPGLGNRFASCSVYARHGSLDPSGRTFPKAAILRTTTNTGFAGGNNVAINFAKHWFSPDYYWLLNNDTRVTPNTLSALIDRMSTDPDAGICGATILSWDGNVQTLGGCRYLKWAGTAAPLYGGRPWPLRVGTQDVEKSMEYVAGASMLVSRRFIETVGLMDEGYFLYFEEIDWARRAAGRFTFRYAPEAVVFHREGGTIGSSQAGIRRSERSFYWLCRSRIRFTLRHHPAALPTVVFFSVMNALRWALPSRNFRILTLCIRGILDAISKPRAQAA